jgi:hypothetical protein
VNPALFPQMSERFTSVSMTQVVVFYVLATEHVGFLVDSADTLRKIPTTGLETDPSAIIPEMLVDVQ